MAAIGRVALWLVCSVCLCCISGQVYAQDTPPSVTTYEGLLREAFAAAQRGDRLGLEQIAPRLNAVTEVTLPNGGTAQVDNTWLHTALAEQEPDLASIASRLGALIDALSQPASTTPPDAQERLKAILGRAPFANAEAPRESWLDRFANWLLEWLARLFQPARRVGTNASSAVVWVVVAFAAILLVGALAYVLLLARRQITRNAQIRSDDPETHLTSTSASQQANDLALGGDYRTAVRYLYLSALLWLDERDMLRYDRALTNREYLMHLDMRSELRGRLAPIVETFDRVWYGYAPLDAQGFEHYRQQVEALRQ